MLFFFISSLIKFRIACICEWEKESFLHPSLSADKLMSFPCVCWQMMSRILQENMSAINGTIIMLLIVVRGSCWWCLK